MSFFKKSLLLIIMVTLLTSCSKYWYKPYGKIFNDMPKNGTPGFRLGWEHGCESGLATQFGGAIYQSFYHWKRDPDIASSKPNLEAIRKRYKKELPINWGNSEEVKKNLSDYNKIFWSAHGYCRASIVGTLQEAGMSPPVPQEKRYDPAAHSLGNVYKLDGRGNSRWSLW